MLFTEEGNFYPGFGSPIAANQDTSLHKPICRLSKNFHFTCQNPLYAAVLFAFFEAK